MDIKTAKIKKAKEIDAFVKKFKKKNKNIDEIISHPKIMTVMNKFKNLMDTTTQQEMDYLSNQHKGFYEFGKFLEKFASSIQAGAFDDLLKK